MDGDTVRGRPQLIQDFDYQNRFETIEIVGGEVVTPTRTIKNGSVLIEDGIIKDIHSAGPVIGDRIVDATGKTVLPGLIDIHGDDIEQHVEPRTGAKIDPQIAMRSADRANVLSGITTKLHAIAFEEAHEESRSIDRANALARIVTATEGLIGDNRLHARSELADASEGEVARWIERGAVELVSLINHKPGTGQFDNEERFMERYSADGGLSEQSVNQLIEKRRKIPPWLVAERGERLQSIAVSHGIPIASHDDESAVGVSANAALGTTISEFPLTTEAASEAKRLDMATVMGAPNLVRGASLWDNMSVRQAIDEGLVDIICSDYHPPSLLAAPFVPTGEPLHERVARVTKNPADVLGFERRGRIEQGARADLIIVDREPVPTVDSLLIEGREIFSTDGRCSHH